MKMDVVYSSDDRYAQHVGVSMVSLFEKNPHFKEINIHLIENQISLVNRKKLRSISEEYNRSLTFLSFQDFSSELDLNMEHSISISAYARLFATRVVEKDIDTLLYLDCDTIINTNLDELFTLNIKDYYVAGVEDTVSPETKKKVGLDSQKRYINSGVMLINLKKWREEGIEGKFINFINYYKGTVFHHDQGVINGVLSDQLLILPPKYNAMTPIFTMTRNEMIDYYNLKDIYNEEDLERAKTKPAIIHYTPAFVNRPWIKGCNHPLTYKYQQYLEMTPWKGTQLEKDNRKLPEKVVAFIFNHLPFKVARGVSRLIFS
ncbi:glycosyltransferase family 8 protein [Bacillus suaedae]|uniref:Glycosyltransferase family 8 protein n=1 Tax=Halalkalibacter suaedae TaxID=2822140 RepID=A0A940WZG7_9BACI|nr:glycosyltransferase family 8 protein [Bacillus suaedae]MBP3951516.1 glycosyltransferase family 8 protein [Bacillus suaedae]